MTAAIWQQGWALDLCGFIRLLTIGDLPSGESPRDHHKEPPPGAAGGRRYRLLIVDDEQMILTLLRQVFGVQYEVEVASGVEQACDWVRRELFDAYLVDLHLLGESGAEVYRAIAALRPGEEQRVVFMSGDVYDSEEAALVRASGNPVVEKPFRLNILREAVRGVIARRGAS